MVVGPEGAKHEDFFIDLLNYAGHKYIRVDDNIKRFSMYDVHTRRLVDATARATAFQKELCPDDCHLSGANLWGFTNVHKLFEFRVAAKRHPDQ